MIECSDVYTFYLTYISRVVAYSGIVFNSLCIIGFSRTKTTNNLTGNVYKHLLAKNICDFFICVIEVIFIEIYECDSCYDDYNLCMFNWILSWYVEFVLFSLSMSFKLAVIFNFFRIITKKFEIFDMIKFRYQLPIIVLFNFYLYIINLLFYRCNEVSQYEDHNNNTIKEYAVTLSNNIINKPIINVIRMNHSFLRDFLCPSVIFVLNILSIVHIKRSLSVKRNVINIKQARKNKLDQTEKKLGLMMICANLMTILGHFPTFFFYVMDTIALINGQSGYENECFISIEQFFFFVSHSINFLFYIWFEKNFQLFFRSWTQKVAIALQSFTFNRSKVSYDT
jgi:hypothetical protein